MAQSKPYTQTLLERVHSPTSASRIHSEKIKHKPLPLLPTTNTASNDSKHDARTQRQNRRKAQQLSRSRKTKSKRLAAPFSAKQKRKLCVHDIPPEEIKWELYEGLHRLWCGYIREILGFSTGEIGAVGGIGGDEVKRTAKTHVTPAEAGAKLASADYHGAMLEVVRSPCVSRVGVKGIVVRDTKFTFTLVTRANQVKSIPKEQTNFRFEVPINVESESANSDEGKDSKSLDIDKVSKSARNLVFELYGSQFETRAPDRANKRVKTHFPPD